LVQPISDQTILSLSIFKLIPEIRVETSETPETRVETPHDISGGLATPVETRANEKREIRKLKWKNKSLILSEIGCLDRVHPKFFEYMEV
jgi:hypothetical protein